MYGVMLISFLVKIHVLVWLNNIFDNNKTNSGCIKFRINVCDVCDVFCGNVFQVHMEQEVLVGKE